MLISFPPLSKGNCLKDRKLRIINSDLPIPTGSIDNPPNDAEKESPYLIYSTEFNFIKSLSLNYFFIICKNHLSFFKYYIVLNFSQILKYFINLFLADLSEIYLSFQNKNRKKDKK